MRAYYLNITMCSSIYNHNTAAVVIYNHRTRWRAEPIYTTILSRRFPSHLIIVCIIIISYVYFLSSSNPQRREAMVAYSSAALMARSWISHNLLRAALWRKMIAYKAKRNETYGITNGGATWEGCHHMSKKNVCFFSVMSYSTTTISAPPSWNLPIYRQPEDEYLVAIDPQ